MATEILTFEVDLPDGSIAEFEYDSVDGKMPTQQELMQAKSNIIQQQGLTPEPEAPPTDDVLSAPPAGAPGVDQPPAFTMEQREELRDIQEEQSRPDFFEGVGRAGVSAFDQVADIYQLGRVAVTNPINASKSLGKAIAGIRPKDVGNFAAELAKDFGRSTMGFDWDREGKFLDKFDQDVLIERWTEQPLSALGDVLIFGKLASVPAKAAGKGLKKSTQKVMHKALARSGDKIQDVAEATLTAKEKAAKAFQTTRQATQQTAPEVTVLSNSEKLALKADIIKSSGVRLKQLNSPDFIKAQSKKMAEKVMDAGADINKARDAALAPAIKKGRMINLGSITDDVVGELTKEGLGTLDDAVKAGIKGVEAATDGVNVITQHNKTKLLKTLKLINEKKSMSVLELRNTIRSLDQAINYNAFRASDQGLKILRGALDKKLGNVVKKYKSLTGGVHERLNKIGAMEMKMRRLSKTSKADLAKYQEDIANKIVKSEGSAKEFIEAMGIANNKPAAQALGHFDLVDATIAWQDLYPPRVPFGLRGDFSGAVFDATVGEVRRQFRFRYPQVDALSKIKVGAKKTGKAVKAPAKAAKKTAKSGAVGTTLTERLIEEN